MGAFAAKFSTALAGAALGSFAACGLGWSGAWTVGEEGFGPVRFGMTVEQAEKALAVKFVRDTYTESDECRYFAPASGYHGLAFMTANGVVVRVDVLEGPDIATDRGAKIGDSEEKVLKLYEGHTKVTPHFYGGLPNHYIKVIDVTGATRLLFETNSGKIDSFRAGRQPQVEYVEGCL